MILRAQIQVMNSHMMDKHIDKQQEQHKRDLNSTLIRISQAVIPDISLNIGSIKLTLKDIVFSDSQFPDCNIQTQPDSNSLYVSILGVNLTLKFQFQIQQQTYPYISDSGDGTIILENVQITGDILEYISSTCIGAEQVNCTDFTLYINQLQIELNSPNSYIYNGILSLITSSLLSIFNTDLQDIMADAFLQVANDGIQSGEDYAFPHGQNNSVVEDQRFVDIIVEDGYFDSMTMGTMCYIVDNVCTGSIQLSNDFPQLQNWGTNNDVQYLLSSDTFLSQFQVIYQQDLFDYQQCQQCDTVQFVNTGMTFNCYFNLNDKCEQIEFLASINSKNIVIKESLEILSIYAQIYNYNVDNQEIDDNTIKNIIDSINPVLNQTSPGINNGNFVNDKECYYKRWDQQWMEVSCNFDGSL